MKQERERRIEALSLLIVSEASDQKIRTLAAEFERLLSLELEEMKSHHRRRVTDRLNPCGRTSPQRETRATPVTAQPGVRRADVASRRAFELERRTSPVRSEGKPVLDPNALTIPGKIPW